VDQRLNSILVDIRDSGIDFHGGKGTLRVVLCGIDFSYGKFYVVKELKITNPKDTSMLHEIISQLKIDN
jgi:hypothetical protein